MSTNLPKPEMEQSSDRKIVIQTAERLDRSPPDRWTQFAQLWRQYPILANVGYAAPDFLPPKFMTQALAQVATSPDPSLNQYPPFSGQKRLRQILAKWYTRVLGGMRLVDPETEVVSTSGATEGIHAAIMAFVGQGDEVILMEPKFECYEPMVRLAGGTPVFISLRPDDPDAPVFESTDWNLDWDELEQKFNRKTKMILVNTPHNPTGKIFTRSELLRIANLCKKWNTLALMDEVFDMIIFDDAPIDVLDFPRMASLPGMWNRTITISSCTKIFPLSGWRVGWAVGPEELIKPLLRIKLLSIECCSTPIEEAVAIGLEREFPLLGRPQSYFHRFTNVQMKPRRNQLVRVLRSMDIAPTVPDSCVFVWANISRLAARIDLSAERGDTQDFRLAMWLVRKWGLVVLPGSTFYTAENKEMGEDWVRITFVKAQETVDKAVQILEEIEKSID